MSDGWECAEPPLPLGQGDVHVWQARLDQPSASVAALASVLAADERARALRFHFERDQCRYTIAHGFLRMVLGAYCHLPPTMLRFGTNRFGKPYLLPPRGTAALRFNLSHSGDRALLAVTLGRAVGVDVEAIQPLDDADLIAQSFFAHAERATLLGLPPSRKTQAFYTCWSRKEAFIKVLGLGLSMPLDRFAVSLAPDAPAQLLAIAGHMHAVPRWQLYDLPPISGYASALALHGMCQRLLCCTWSPAGLLTA